jgi:hypothetical protein
MIASSSGSTRLSIGASLLMSVLCPGVFPQGSASILGRVTDPSGAVVPGANVVATETRTRLSRAATSSADGYFAIPLLRPAEYELVG